MHVIMLLYSIIVVNNGHFIMYFIIIKVQRYSNHSHLVCFLVFILLSLSTETKLIITLLLSSTLKLIHFQSITESYTNLNHGYLASFKDITENFAQTFVCMFLNRVLYRRQVFIFSVGVCTVLKLVLQLHSRFVDGY